MFDLNNETFHYLLFILGKAPAGTQIAKGLHHHGPVVRQIRGPRPGGQDNPQVIEISAVAPTLDEGVDRIIDRRVLRCHTLIMPCEAVRTLPVSGAPSGPRIASPV